MWSMSSGAAASSGPKSLNVPSERRKPSIWPWTCSSETAVSVSSTGMPSSSGSFTSGTRSTVALNETEPSDSVLRSSIETISKTLSPFSSTAFSKASRTVRSAASGAMRSA